MLKRKLTLILFVLFGLYAKAQNIENTLSLYSQNFPQEKIHIHFDKENYLPGETIWFKAYLFADDLPTTSSTNFYADLLDSKGKLLEHKTMPILNATADNYFKLPDNSNNTYIIKAYTTWMLNFDTAFIYYKKITVSNNSTPNIINTKPDISLQFFAEGGNMLVDQYNYVAFKAMQPDGTPYEINGVVKNKSGQLVDSIYSVHDGMGLLKFSPEPGENYTAEWKDAKGEWQKTVLPQSQTKGVLLHTDRLKDDLYYLVKTAGNEDNLQELSVIATMFQRTVYQAKIKVKQNSVNQKFNTKDFPTGILQLTVFDKNSVPVAERIVFINNNNYKLPATIQIKETGVEKRGRNQIEIEVPDTLNSNLSLAVYDDNLDGAQSATNIYTNLLLQGDIKGYVYNAAWYFSDTATNATAYLDLVMQTNGWRRYNWDKIVSNTMPTIVYPKDSYLNIYGKATDNKAQPVNGVPITLMVETKDSTKNWYQPLTNKDGIFSQKDLIFYDTATVYWKTANLIKGTAFGLGVAKDYNGLFSVKLVQSLPDYLQNNAALSTGAYTQLMMTEIQNKNAAFEREAKLLQAITIKSGGWHNWRNDPLVKMDDKYTSGVFRGGSTSYSFDLLHDKNATDKQDVYNYIMSKIPGIKVGYSNMGKSLAGNGTGIYVNEQEQDDSYLRTLNIEDIAYIKYIPRFAGLQGLPPIISIYLKKDKDYQEDAKKMAGNLSKITVAGYSPVKEFYSPDYFVPTDKQANVDLRTTLLWQPYILLNAQNKKIPVIFYNNDFSKRLRIVLEGINDDGKLIHIEKIIQ